MTMKRLLLVLIFFPSLLCAQLPTFFHEDFSDNDFGWSERSDDKKSYAVKDGVYHFKNTSETGWYASKTIFTDPYQDFEIEATFTHLSGPLDKGFGFVLGDYRRTKENNYNYFLISGNQKTKIYSYSDKTKAYDTFLDWTHKPDIIKGTGEKNILMIKRQRGAYSMSINGRNVFYFTKGDFWGKSIGFIIYERVEMTVDDVKVKQLYRDIQLADIEDIKFEKENVGEAINSHLSELTPRIAHDGQTLYYVRELENDDQNIFYSELDENGDWMPSKDIGFPLNSDDFSNSVIAITPDNNQLLLTNHYKDNEQGISKTKRASFGWAFPSNFEIDDYYNLNGYHNFSLSPNRKVLFLTIEREDSFGEKDIYVSFLNEDGDEFSQPQNLGPVLNTAGDESSIFVAGDGTIYFSTDGLPGYGSNDIFMSRKLDDTWLNWAPPLNMGSSINSSDWDSYFVIPVKGEYAYMVSSESGFGRSDIFRIKVSEKARPEPVVLIKGKVLDSKTNDPIEAAISYRDLIDDKELGIAYSDKKTGKYQIILPYGRKYSFLAQKKGYFPISENIDVTDLEEFAEVTNDLELAPVEVGLVVRLNNIFFDFNKADLLPESFAELNRLVDLMNDNPKLKIEIGGHTDNKGDDAYNQNLSQQRVNSVVNYLKEKGIDEGRFKGVGYGESQPIASNETEEGMQLNRRVEFKILKN